MSFFRSNSPDSQAPNPDGVSVIQKILLPLPTQLHPIPYFQHTGSPLMLRSMFSKAEDITPPPSSMPPPFHMMGADLEGRLLGHDRFPTQHDQGSTSPSRDPVAYHASRDRPHAFDPYANARDDHNNSISSYKAHDASFAPSQFTTAAYASSYSSSRDGPMHHYGHYDQHNTTSSSSSTPSYDSASLSSSMSPYARTYSQYGSSHPLTWHNTSRAHDLHDGIARDPRDDHHHYDRAGTDDQDTYHHPGPALDDPSLVAKARKPLVSSNKKVPVRRPPLKKEDSLMVPRGHHHDMHHRSHSPSSPPSSAPSSPSRASGASEQFMDGVVNLLNMAERSKTKCSLGSCVLCERGTPSCLESSSAWSTVLRVVLYCLRYSSDFFSSKFCTLKGEIYPFISAHWEALCLSRARDDTTWHKQVQDALSHTRDYFESGLEVYQQYGYWRLKVVDDPWRVNSMHVRTSKRKSTDAGKTSKRTTTTSHSTSSTTAKDRTSP
eukprot:TRINITY_DN5912_c0_g1_i2.p1 TRINITY_DN5912_c0_g1~~TRINITY_DN5912_c0_g1_i2.p1  ORF type:complete len:492 (+),score=91.14 TRINITY_DN5912_c0_g1_i2:229-1704(+)